MSGKSLLRTLAAIGAMGVLTACSWAPNSNWHLMDSGFSIDAVSPSEFAIEVHVNLLKQIGGEINSAEFRRFVSERLKWHGMCSSGWTLLPCAEDGSCIQRTHRSVTVPGRCSVS